MKNIKVLFSIVCLLFFFASCKERLFFNFEQLRSGKLIAPLAGKNILIIDNSANQPEDKGHIFAINNQLVGDTLFDTNALSSYVVHSVSNYLSATVPFNSIESTTNRLLAPKLKDEDYLYAAPLPNKVLRSLSVDPKNQVLLSLDLLHIMTVTHSHFSKSILSYATRDVLLQSIWRVYDLENDSLLMDYECLDSLFWKSEGKLDRPADSLLPPMDDVLEEIGDVLAKKVIDQVLPSWESVKREYFCGGSFRMREASDWLQLDSIKKAADLWEIEYSKSIFRSKYRSAMNMMLYFEVIGKPEESLIWAENAERAMKNSPFGSTYYDEGLLTSWKMILQNRVKEIKRLNTIYIEL